MSIYLVEMADNEDIKRELSYDEGAVAKTFGRDRFLVDSTPSGGINRVDHPFLSSTRMPHNITSPQQQAPDPVANVTGEVCPRTSFSTNIHFDTFSPLQHNSREDLSSPDVGNLIT